MPGVRGSMYDCVNRIGDEDYIASSEVFHYLFWQWLRVGSSSFGGELGVPPLAELSYRCRIGPYHDSKHKAICNSQIATSHTPPPCVYRVNANTNSHLVLLVIRLPDRPSHGPRREHNQAACRGMVAPALCPSAARSMERNLS